jgi:hypothetical protein
MATAAKFVQSKSFKKIELLKKTWSFCLHIFLIYMYLLLVECVFKIIWQKQNTIYRYNISINSVIVRKT